MSPWRILKSRDEWVLIERKPAYLPWDGRVTFRSKNWRDCIEYMDAIESGNVRKVYSMIMERATLCKGF